MIDDTAMTYEVRDTVATVRFQRPGALNALRRRDFLDLTRHLAEARASSDVSAVVITGSGRAFSAGEDLHELAETLPGLDASEVRVHVEQLQDLTRLILAIDKPVIAAVNGLAVGVGAEIAVACDLRVAAESARFSFPEVSRGLFETNGVTWLLPRMIGRGRALRVMLTGEFVDADTCLAWGLVDEVVPDADLDSHVHERAVRLGQGAPVSLAWVKAAVTAGMASDLETALALEVEGVLACLATDDLQEGLTAFREGRSPSFRSREP